VTIIGAIALRGIVAFVNILGASNSLTFEAFIVRCLLPNRNLSRVNEEMGVSGRGVDGVW
jgi:hypothetical protein